MKKFLALILALLLACSLVACSGDDEGDEGPTDLTVTSTDLFYNAGGNYGDQFEYKIINGNEIAIIGFKSDYAPHEITVPATIEECRVVEISDAAFYHCSQITAVNVPAGVRTIGNMAFAGCAQLTRVSFATEGTVLTAIGDYAFSYCGKLTTIALPDSLAALGEGAFFRCTELTAINIPNVVRDGEGNVVKGIAALGDMTFMGCEKLATVTGGDELTAIGAYAFSCCKALTAYTVPASVEVVGAYAFSLCDTLASITFANTTGWRYAIEGGYEAIDVSDPSYVSVMLKGQQALYTLERQ